MNGGQGQNQTANTGLFSLEINYLLTIKTVTYGAFLY